MIARVTILIASLLAAAPAMAQSMNAEAAQRFVTGNLFGFSCFEGSRGVGQIYSDGSVTGTIQVSGSGPVRFWASAGDAQGDGRRSMRDSQRPVI